MLSITITPTEMFDEKTNSFIQKKSQTLQLEHSLVSISKWESKWKKAFLGKNAKTLEETIDYIRCMTITQNVDPDIYEYLSQKNIEDINNYINDPMTATTFSVDINNNNSNKETPTSELIYYWMMSNNIPMECQKWHINRLMTLIRVFSVKNTPPKKMSKREIASKYASLNAARRKQFNSHG